ncbi:MAG: FxDxF family PEP-CTERM protein [Pseudomonadota bacterium]
MNHSKSLIAAVLLAGASMASSAVLAADISTPPQALNLLDNSAFFGDAFAMNNMSNTFADHFTFNVSAAGSGLDAIVSSIARTAATGLDITGLNLYNGSGLVATGTMVSSGAQDVWTLSANGLAIGSYYVQVSGNMLSTTSGSFGGSVMLAPVPEPATFGMLLAGLGVAGWLARRRKPG